MSTPRAFAGLVLVCSALGSAGPAAASANIGGVVSLVGGAGLCNVSASVPQSTAQDSFMLGRSTGCAGTAADAQIRGSAATASVGLRAASSGDGLGSSQVAAQVRLMDQWQINVPAGTPLGTINLPLSLDLEGSISGAAVYAPQFGRYLDYDLHIGLPFSFNVLSATGTVSTTGAFSQTFNGSIAWQYTGQPLQAAIDLNLMMFGLNEGTLNFYNSASASILLPAGFSATTSSGLPLVFAPVPEPSPAALLAAGLAFLMLAMNWRCGTPPLDFVGFAIQYREPCGTRFFTLKDRLAFESTPSTVQLSTLVLPIQSFRWVHFPFNADMAGAFVYRVTPVFMNARDEISHGPAQEAEIELRRETFPGLLNVSFTRGFVSSQAFVDHFANQDGIRTLLPANAEQGLDFKPTHSQAAKALAWTGFEARSALLELLDQGRWPTPARRRAWWPTT